MPRRSSSGDRLRPARDGQSPVEIGSVDRIVYDPLSETYLANFDWTATDSPVVPLVELVSAIEDRSACELEAAFDGVDPDALNRLFEPAPDDSPEASGTVSLRLLGHHVTVFASGTILVRP